MPVKPYFVVNASVAELEQEISVIGTALANTTADGGRVMTWSERENMKTRLSDLEGQLERAKSQEKDKQVGLSRHVRDAVRPAMLAITDPIDGAFARASVHAQNSTSLTVTQRNERLRLTTTLEC